MNRFGLLAALVLVGCGAKEEPANAPVKMDSVTMDAPTETRLDEKGTLKDLEKEIGIAPLTGSESEPFMAYKRGDGGKKYALDFTAKGDIASVMKFYSGQGLDSRMEGGKGTSMGMSKTNSQVMVHAEPATGGGTKVTISALVYPKSPAK